MRFSYVRLMRVLKMFKLKRSNTSHPKHFSVHQILAFFRLISVIRKVYNIELRILY